MGETAPNAERFAKVFIEDLRMRTEEANPDIVKDALLELARKEVRSRETAIDDALAILETELKAAGISVDNSLHQKVLEARIDALKAKDALRKLLEEIEPALK